MREKRIIQLITVVSMFFLLQLCPQKSYCKVYEKYNDIYAGLPFTVYKFSRERIGGERVYAKYFAHNAYKSFTNWRIDKRVIMVCAGGFSISWDVNSNPSGLCIDNGAVVNRAVSVYRDSYGNSLDGLVIVYNGGVDAGGIALTDIQRDRVCTQYPNRRYDIKNNSSDTNQFIDWAEKNSATVFQLPLMYSYKFGKNYGSLNYGNKKGRRFLAICKGKNAVIYHLIIDVRSNVNMNAAADKIIDYLGKKYSLVYGVLVLEAGAKDILYEYDGARVTQIGNNGFDTATNLLVYYIQ